jgi:signal transduction histidine kinase
MADDAALADATHVVAQRRSEKTRVRRILDYLPQGNLLTDDDWRRRHNLLQWFLVLHIPVWILFGLYKQHSITMVMITVAPIAAFRLLGGLPAGRRVQSFFTTAGIVYAAAALVVLSNGAIEAHFDFFVIIGFIALYQDWVPFGWNVVFTVLSHGIGSAFKPGIIFNTMAGMDHPWQMSFVHGFAVLLACVGMVLFWRTNEDEQEKTLLLTEELSEREIARRKFTSDLLVNLARRNQSMLYRQLDIINQLEEKEQDPDALFELFRLDHLATRIRRNAENLLVLSGEEPPRVWGKPVPLTDVVRAAIAETEDLSRVSFSVDERLTLVGQAVIDVTHLLAELIENAVRFSPPESRVTVRSAPDVRSLGSIMFTVEDWGVGMPAADLEDANRVLAQPRDVDTLVSNRLGLHVISRLAHRYAIRVVLAATSGSGITAVLVLPPELFVAGGQPSSTPPPAQFPTLQPGAEPRSTSAARRRPAPVEPQYEPQNEPLAYRPLPPKTQQPQRAERPQPVSAALQALPVAAAPVQRAAPFQPQPRPQVRASTPAPTRTSTPTSPRTPSQATNPATPITASIQVDRLGSAPRWDGWWEADAPSPTPPPPQTPPPPPPPARAAAPQPAAAQTNGNANGNGNGNGNANGNGNGADVPVRLARRTPQAHLAPELQRDREPLTGSGDGSPSAPAAPNSPPPDAERAREALSRYQASRQAALAEQDPAERNRS